VDVFPGDMEDAAALAQALHGVYGVFCVQNYWEKSVGYAGEVRQAHTLILAAQAANISHLVYSSIAGCDNAHGVEHFESKWETEKLLVTLSVPHTILRTVFFMDNFIDRQTGSMMLPVLAGALKPGTRFHMLATDDIGWFAAEAFANPDQYLGITLALAGDSLTVAEMKQVHARVTGQTPPRFTFPVWLLRLMNGEMARQLDWNNEIGWHFDIEKLRALHPELISFEKFLQAHAPRRPALPPTT